MMATAVIAQGVEWTGYFRLGKRSLHSVQNIATMNITITIMGIINAVAPSSEAIVAILVASTTKKSTTTHVGSMSIKKAYHAYHKAARNVRRATMSHRHGSRSN